MVDGDTSRTLNLRRVTCFLCMRCHNQALTTQLSNSGAAQYLIILVMQSHTCILLLVLYVRIICMCGVQWLLYETHLLPPHHLYLHQTAFKEVRCLCYLSLQVKLSVVFEYVRSLTWYMAFLILLFNLLANGLSVGGNFWLAAWSDREDKQTSISGAETYV